MDFS
jgi:hypothetical protein